MKDKERPVFRCKQLQYAEEEGEKKDEVDAGAPDRERMKMIGPRRNERNGGEGTRKSWRAGGADAERKEPDSIVAATEADAGAAVAAAVALAVVGTIASERREAARRDCQNFRLIWRWFRRLSPAASESRPPHSTCSSVE